MSSTQNTQTKSEEKKAAPPSNKLYVRWEVNDDILKGIFEKYGKVSEARVVRGPRLRNFGFLTFETEGEATKALNQLNGKSISTSALTIEYASSEREENAEGGEGSGRGRGRGRRGRGGNNADRKDGGDKDGETKTGGSRRGRGGRNNANNASADGGDSKQARGNGDGERGRGGRRGRQRRRGGKTEGGSENKERSQRAEENKRERESNPNWGKFVVLSPDPIKTPVPKDAVITELQAGTRTYRAGRTDAKQIAYLVLGADPTKGPFNCDFKLGEFELKLLEVRVTSKAGDTRVGCRILHPASDRSREVYLRVRTGGPNAHKFLELRKENPKADAKEDDSAPTEAFFVAIDSISLDVNTGLWKQIRLSLSSLQLTPRQR